MRKMLAALLLLLVCILPSCGQTSDDLPDEQTLDTEDQTVAVEEETIASDEQNSAPDEHSLVAHAGGAVYGFRLTNSLEALNTAYENGFRLIELDFEITSDGEYVLIHDWDSMAERMIFERGTRTLEDFQLCDTFMELTLLDLSALIEWVGEHRDCYIITDAKCENIPFLERLYEVSGELSGNFIPQVYSYSEYGEVEDIGYEHIILTLYRMKNIDSDELFDFAVRKKIFGITIAIERLDEEILFALDSINVNVYAHTVNDVSFFEEWRERGLFGIYTDYYYPAKWPY